ncbi:uncharacterized protein LOC112567481 [Pomacea canaliculata]|uniref:uncharacterized protein LOC112567481 n=1 Tax=Pomacea canaliculata TaxID=400727 RepID=UPI000D73F560|nr:uncharacterized protein LOC112567481 [Pomacea canaliculata]
MMLYHLLLQTVSTQQSAGVSSGQPHLLLFDLYSYKDAEKAVNDLSQAARGGSLYVIADEVSGSSYFCSVCDKLLTQVPHLHLWAASCYHGNATVGWQVEYLTRPLRSPPAVVREVEQDRSFTNDRDVLPYSERGVPDHTDGPPVRRLYHQRHGHSGDSPENVTTTATTLTSTNGGTRSPCLQWRDVLVLYWIKIRDDSGMMKGLEEAGIPVRVMKDDDTEDVATARSDVVWVTSGSRVCGLERKVVVCLEDQLLSRFYSMSRCTSQLLIVYS